jgi:hypothetical protein
MRQLCVLLHSPGPAWDRALRFMEQPGIEEHVAFMRSLTARGLMVLGGPFGDGDAGAGVGMAVSPPETPQRQGASSWRIGLSRAD